MTYLSNMPFAGFPFDRASVKRRDAAFISGLLDDANSDLILIHDGRPVLELPAQANVPRRALRLSAA